MKVSLKFILATILLMLSYSIGGNAMDFASCVSKCESSCQLSESSSDIKSNSSLNSRAVGFDKSSQSLTISDVELGFKSVSETSSNNYRLRRIIEVNDSLKDVMHKFSLLRENSLVLDQSKSYYSDKYPYLVFSLFLRINLLFVLCMNCVIFCAQKVAGAVAQCI